MTMLQDFSLLLYIQPVKIAHSFLVRQSVTFVIDTCQSKLKWRVNNGQRQQQRKLLAVIDGHFLNCLAEQVALKTPLKSQHKPDGDLPIRILEKSTRLIGIRERVNPQKIVREGFPSYINRCRLKLIPNLPGRYEISCDFAEAAGHRLA